MTSRFGVLPKKQSSPFHDYILKCSKLSFEFSFSISIFNSLLRLEFILCSFTFQVDSLLSQHHLLNNSFYYLLELAHILYFFLKIIYLFIYLFMAVLGLRFCARAFSSCGKWGPLFIAVCGPLIIAASPVVEHRLQMRRLSNCGSRA